MAGLRLILPKNTVRTVAHRFGALNPRLAVELYEHDSLLNVLEKTDPRSAGNVDTFLCPLENRNRYYSAPSLHSLRLLLQS